MSLAGSFGNKVLRSKTKEMKERYLKKETNIEREAT